MGMTVTGLNLIRNAWSSLIDAIELGTGTTQETVQDTDLVTPIVGSESVGVSATTANQFLLKTGRVYSTQTDISGETPTELIWKKQSPELASSRVTFSSVTWDYTMDIVVETRWVFRGRLG